MSKEFDEFLEMLSSVPILFWVCPKGCRGRVVHHPQKKCLECGFTVDHGTNGLTKGGGDGES